MPRERRKSKIRPKSPEACAYHRNVFQPRVASLRTEIESIPLTVLVWGPAQSDSILYDQRVAIINALRDRGFDAETSEALTESTEEWSIKSQEFMQAMAADLIVILCASPGSIAEMCGFSGFEQIARKMVVFIDHTHRESYVSLGPARDLTVYGNVQWYSSPIDFNEGKLVNSVLHVARQHQFAAWLRTASVANVR